MGSRIRPLSQVERIFDVFCEVSFKSRPSKPASPASTEYYNQPVVSLFEDEFVPQDLIRIRRQSSISSPGIGPMQARRSLVPSNDQSSQTATKITYHYPTARDQIDPEVLKSVPSFAHPCHIQTDSVIHFTFVLTSADSKWTFGFVRATNDQALVLLSALPWNESFFRILNHVHSLPSSPTTSPAHAREHDVRQKFLSALYHTPLPETAGNPLTITYCSHANSDLTSFSMSTFDYENRLPAVPEDRNLTEYLNAVDAGTTMITMFASVLNERRIIVTSSRLCRLTSTVQAMNQLMFPMCWQHIFIPVLPAHLTDYLSAPMPFLIGVPAETMSLLYSDNRSGEWGEGVVVLDADTGSVQSPFQDVASLPTPVVSFLKKSLSPGSHNHHSSSNSVNGTTGNSLLGDRIARSFLKAIVMLIGGYRDALVFPAAVAGSESRITFDPTSFISSRPPAMQPFLERMLQLQLFQQFIQTRIAMLHEGFGLNDEFEREVGVYELEGGGSRLTSSSSSSHISRHFKTQYNDWLTKCKKTSKGSKDFVIKSVNHPVVKSAVKQVKSGSRSAVRAVRKGIVSTQHRVSSGMNSSSNSHEGDHHQRHSMGNGSGARPKTMHFYGARDEDAEPEIAVEAREDVEDGKGKLSGILTIEKTAKTATYVRPSAVNNGNKEKKGSDSTPDLIALSLDDDDQDDDEDEDSEEEDSDPMQFDPLFQKPAHKAAKLTLPTTAGTVAGNRNGILFPAVSATSGGDGVFGVPPFLAPPHKHASSSRKTNSLSPVNPQPFLPPPPPLQMSLSSSSMTSVQTRRKQAQPLPGQLVSLSPPATAGQQPSPQFPILTNAKENGGKAGWQMFE